MMKSDSYSYIVVVGWDWMAKKKTRITGKNSWTLPLRNYDHPTNSPTNPTDRRTGWVTWTYKSHLNKAFNFQMRSISISHPFPHLLTHSLTHWNAHSITNVTLRLLHHRGPIICYASIGSSHVHILYLSSRLVNIFFWGEKVARYRGSNRAMHTKQVRLKGTAYSKKAKMKTLFSPRLKKWNATNLTVKRSTDGPVSSM